MEHKGRFFLTTALLVMILVAATISASFSYLNVTTSENSIEDESESVNSKEGVLTLSPKTPISFSVGAVNANETIATITFDVVGDISTNKNLNYQINLNIDNNTYQEGTVLYTLTSANTSSNGVVVKSTEKPLAIQAGNPTIIVGSATGSFSGPVTKGTHTYTVNIYRSETSATYDGDASAISGSISISATE